MRAGVLPARLRAVLRRHRERAAQGGPFQAEHGHALPQRRQLRATSGTGPSATLAIARMAGIIPVMAPGLRDSLADLDALSGSSRLVFCGKVSPDKALLFSSRGVPVLRLPAEELADAYLVQRDLEVNECTVIPCGDTLGDIAEKASAVAMDIKRKVSAV